VGVLVASGGWDSGNSPAEARLLWWPCCASHGVAWFELMCTFSASVEVVRQGRVFVFDWGKHQRDEAQYV
jgi:hypothetical protein